jgi:hypothetical protein
MSVLKLTELAASTAGALPTHSEISIAEPWPSTFPVPVERAAAGRVVALQQLAGEQRRQEEREAVLELLAHREAREAGLGQRTAGPPVGVDVPHHDPAVGALAGEAEVGVQVEGRARHADGVAHVADAERVVDDRQVEGRADLVVGVEVEPEGDVVEGVAALGEQRVAGVGHQAEERLVREVREQQPGAVGVEEDVAGRHRGGRRVGRAGGRGLAGHDERRRRAHDRARADRLEVAPRGRGDARQAAVERRAHRVSSGGLSLRRGRRRGGRTGVRRPARAGTES